MSQGPDYTQSVSLRLSEVLDNIGVNERIVMQRRRERLLIESTQTSSAQLDDILSGCSIYYFGSKSEGTTTPGLKSDSDVVFFFDRSNIIKDLSEWEPGVSTYLMIEDESVSPGYCLLQNLRSDVPCQVPFVLDKHHHRDRLGRILVKNTIVHSTTRASVARENIERSDEKAVKVLRHGPAAVLTEQFWGNSQDYVFALKCKSWPLKARQWLDQQGVGHWPSDDMRRNCGNTSCFVVAVGRKGSEYEELEWRISTSLAERRLMFSLNITQIRCYVLMKMLVKTYIKPYYEDAISSFMCKTVLFQTIANTHSNFWRESNLIVCLTRCLLVLYNCVLNESCPHFIITENNLMAGNIARESKSHILGKLQYIMINKEKSLLEIQCDDLGASFLSNSSSCQFKMSDRISNNLVLSTLAALGALPNLRLTDINKCSHEVAIRTLLKYIFKLHSISNQGQELEKKACILLNPWFCTTLGSVLASLSIQQYKLSEKALGWISMGLNTDVSASKLKQASMFYCIGDSQRTQIVLRDIEECYDQNVAETICICHDYNNTIPRRFFEIIDNQIEDAIQYIAAFCVRFLQCEINCVPHELRYEMFRSTKDDLAFRSLDDDLWMDLAVVDSLPYLYFLQYKAYTNLGRQDDKQRALSNLIRTIEQEPNLAHRETARNLLGQCMEGEDRVNDALNCYVLSLSLRGRNNAAKVHICRLLSKLVNDQARN